MKLFIIKLFIIVISFSSLFLFFTRRVEANIPDVLGRVVTNTGAPVKGVWVRWKDSKGSLYYEQTDKSGSFVFAPADASNYKSYMNKRIDTNLDGTKDTYQVVLAPDADEEESHSCLTNSHSFSVVKPVGTDGSFSSISGVSLNNSNGTHDLSDIIYTPALPTSTPTPTPGGPTLAPTPTDDPALTPTPGGPTSGPTSALTPTPALMSQISGNVFFDTDLDGVKDAGEIAYTGGVKITVVGEEYATRITDSDGNYLFSTLPEGSYKVYIIPPKDYSSTSGSSKSVTIGPPAVVDFGLVRTYTIKGNVFNDVNKNYKMDADETPLLKAKVKSTGGAFAVNDGSYEIRNLRKGTYTVTYISSLPTGFLLLYPKPPAFTLTVGPNCGIDLDTKTGASCEDDSIKDLNFAVSDSWPWLQTYQFDLRYDNGFQNPQPASTTCGGGSFASSMIESVKRTYDTPGIVFTGDGSADFGQGLASNREWVTGGLAYSEEFRDKAPLKTSTQNLRALAIKAGISIESLESHGPCKKPAEKCNLKGLEKGFYYTSGDILIDKSVDFKKGTYVIVAGGSITIKESVNIASGSGAAIFAAGRDIIIDQTVHADTNICPVPDDGQLQGIFSADRNIIIQGNNGDCIAGADKMLNIDGALIANAVRKGGSIQNQRDLCADNRIYPYLTVRARPDFIFKIPGFITEQNPVFYEEMP